MSGVARRIGLLDHMGGGNLGDDATQTAAIQNIQTRWPGAELAAFSMNPSDSEKRHGIPAYAIRRKTWSPGPVRAEASLGADASKPEKGGVSSRARVQSALGNHPLLFTVLRLVNLVAIRTPREFLAELAFLLKSFGIMRRFDLLIISGGGQLLDSSGGPWQFPYTIWKWILLARLSKARCVFLNVGAGPLGHRLSIFFVRQALRFADYVSFRDQDSQALIQRLGFKGRSTVVADNVYALEMPAGAPGGGRKAGNVVVGLSPMAYCDPRVYWKKDQAVYDGLIRNLARVASALIDSGHGIRLFATDISFDRQTIEDLKDALERDLDLVHRSGGVVERIDTTEELLSKMSLMDYVVTCRFHGVVFAHLLNKPMLALSHHPKVATLMSDIGLSEYCIDIHNFDAALVLKKFALMVRNADGIKRRLAETLGRYRSELAQQLDGLFPRELRGVASLEIR